MNLHWQYFIIQLIKSGMSSFRRAYVYHGSKSKTASLHVACSRHEIEILGAGLPRTPKLS